MVLTNSSLDLADRRMTPRCASIRRRPRQDIPAPRSLWTMPCSFSSRENISHDHQKRQLDSPSPTPHRFAVKRTHGSIRTGGRVGRVDSAPDSANRLPTLLLEHRSLRPAELRPPAAPITDRNNVIVASALGRAENPAVVSQPPPDTRSDRIDRRPVKNGWPRSDGGRHAMAAPSRRLRRLRFLAKAGPTLEFR